ncbi:MAG: hypothetical protein QOJ29_3966 [Thermoleophilaceae bacterium]|nr:hypothetical protein [Thermoleophilaceae bacterium]
MINARAAVRPEVSGVERWAREMVMRLPALRPGAYYIAQPPPGFAHKRGQLWEQAVLPVRAARRRARLVFSPANLAPLAWPRNVVVIHDAVVLSHPEWFSPAYVAWHSRMTRANAKRAVRVVVPSQFSAEELAELAGVPRDRLVVIPGGVDERFAPDVDPQPAASELQLEQPYVLTVGGLGERKNLRALEPLAPALAERGVELVAVGVRRSHHSHSDDLRGVRPLGYVSEELLPSLYAGARAFVLPSLHEGFGLTCIEAMRSGVPVAASDRGALPEACGGAALHFDPDDAVATEAAVLRVVEDEIERERLRAAGIKRAAELTWDRAAQAVDALLFADA